MIPTGLALFLAFCCLLCGVAMAVSLRYRYALALWLVVVVSFGAAGISCQVWLCDALLVCGGLLGAFGVARGIAALAFKEVAK